MMMGGLSLSFTRQQRVGGATLDSDAATYIAAVETADGEALEAGVKTAIDTFVKGLKTDGLWDSIQAACIMAGARSVAGALVPLKGTAPTNYNFVGADYSRTDGIKGDGSTKYLDSNRAGNADGQDDHHLSAYVVTGETGGSNRGIAGNDLSASGMDVLYMSSIGYGGRSRGDSSSRVYAVASAFSAPNLLGISRSTSSDISFFDGATNTSAISSLTPLADTVQIFNRTGGSFTDARLSWYSIGGALTLADLDSRVSTLMTDIGSALA